MGVDAIGWLCAHESEPQGLGSGSDGRIGADPLAPLDPSSTPMTTCSLASQRHITTSHLRHAYTFTFDPLLCTLVPHSLLQYIRSLAQSRRASYTLHTAHSFVQ